MYALITLNHSSVTSSFGIYHVEDKSLKTDIPFVEMTNVTSHFSFTPLAVVNPSGVNSNAVYIYHQINESAFAEEAWDGDLNVWTSSAIGVETLTWPALVPNRSQRRVLWRFIQLTRYSILNTRI